MSNLELLKKRSNLLIVDEDLTSEKSYFNFLTISEVTTDSAWMIPKIIFGIIFKLGFEISETFLKNWDKPVEISNWVLYNFFIKTTFFCIDFVFTTLF